MIKERNGTEDIECDTKAIPDNRIIIYVVPGLGAGPEILKNIPKSNLFRLQSIQWLDAEPEEPLSVYASRLCQQVNTRAPFLLAGISFGGVLAIEMARILNTDQVLIISSIKCRQEGPFYFYWIKKFGIASILPLLLKFTFLVPQHVLCFAFTVEKAHGSMLSRMLSDTPPNFLCWALLALLSWDKSEYRGRIVHVHGAADRLFPIKFVQPDITVPDAGHFLIFTHGHIFAEACLSRLNLKIRDIHDKKKG